MAPGSVLLIDDEEKLRSLLKRIIQLEGYTVTEASGLRAGLKVLEKEPIDIVLCDVKLPDGSGVDVCVEVRAWSNLPIIVLSAVGDEREKVRALDAGADDYITKPFSPRELVARVKAVLRRCEAPPAPAVIRAGDLELDALAMVLTVRGMVITATATEFRLLH